MQNNCQPNFWTNVVPDPKTSCGPYKPDRKKFSDFNLKTVDYRFSEDNHDTIGMLVLTENGTIFAGVSTNGLDLKIPGCVSDSTIPGSGAYCNNKYGAAHATGNVDIMMRHLPSFAAVELLKNGYSPQEAAEEVLGRMIDHYYDFWGAVLVVDKNGNYAAACNNMKNGFPFTVADEKGVRLEIIPCHGPSTHD